MKVRIAGIGSEIPARRVTNADVAQIVDTSDEWVVKNIGIKTRSRIGLDQTTFSLGADAARKALAQAGLAADDFDFLICATNSQEDIFPSTASKIQAALGATRAASFDVQAGCTGWLFGMQLATGLLQSGQARRVLVVGTESLLRSLYLYMRETVLFGDGAGAAVLVAEDGANDAGAPLCFASETTPSFAMHHPSYFSEENNAVELYLEHRDLSQVPRPVPKMDGKASMKLALTRATAMIDRVLAEAQEKYGITKSDIRVFMPHQTNVHLVKKLCEYVGVPFENIPYILEKYGCISTASMATGLAEHHAAGRIAPGDLVLCVGFGAGFTAAAMLFRWEI